MLKGDLSNNGCYCLNYIRIVGLGTTRKSDFELVRTI